MPYSKPKSGLKNNPPKSALKYKPLKSALKHNPPKSAPNSKPSKSKTKVIKSSKLITLHKKPTIVKFTPSSSSVFSQNTDVGHDGDTISKFEAKHARGRGNEEAVKPSVSRKFKPREFASTTGKAYRLSDSSLELMRWKYPSIYGVPKFAKERARDEAQKKKEQSASGARHSAFKDEDGSDEEDDFEDEFESDEAESYHILKTGEDESNMNLKWIKRLEDNRDPTPKKYGIPILIESDDKTNAGLHLCGPHADRGDFDPPNNNQFEVDPYVEDPALFFKDKRGQPRPKSKSSIMHKPSPPKMEPLSPLPSSEEEEEPPTVEPSKPFIPAKKKKPPPTPKPIKKSKKRPKPKPPPTPESEPPQRRIRTPRPPPRSPSAPRKKRRPGKPSMYYVDDSVGTRHKYCPSGLAPLYIHKEDFGKIPNYLKQRNVELGRPEEPDFRDFYRPYICKYYFGHFHCKFCGLKHPNWINNFRRTPEMTHFSTLDCKCGDPFARRDPRCARICTPAHYKHPKRIGRRGRSKSHCRPKTSNAKKTSKITEMKSMVELSKKKSLQSHSKGSISMFPKAIHPLPPKEFRDPEQTNLSKHNLPSKANHQHLPLIKHNRPSTYDAFALRNKSGRPTHKGKHDHLDGKEKGGDGDHEKPRHRSKDKSHPSRPPKKGKLKNIKKADPKPSSLSEIPTEADIPQIDGYTQTSEFVLEESESEPEPILDETEEVDVDDGSDTRLSKSLSEDSIPLSPSKSAESVEYYDEQDDE